MNKKLVLAAGAMAMGLTLLQNQSSGQAPDVQKDRQDLGGDRKDLRDDLKGMQALDAKHADAIRDLNSREKAAMEAVKEDKSLTPAQRKEKLAEVRKDFNAQRKDLNSRFRADKKSFQADMKKDRADMRQDRRDLRQDARSGGMDRGRR